MRYVNRVGIGDSAPHVKIYLIEYSTNNINAYTIYIVSTDLMTLYLALFTACLLLLSHNYLGTFRIQRRLIIRTEAIAPLPSLSGLPPHLAEQ